MLRITLLVQGSYFCIQSSLCESFLVIFSSSVHTSSPIIALIIFFLIYFFGLCWVFVAAHGLSLVAVSRGYSSLRCAGFSLPLLLFLWSTGSRAPGLQQLWCMGLVAPRHVGFSRTRIEPVSPALAGGFLTTVPPGKSL